MALRGQARPWLARTCARWSLSPLNDNHNDAHNEHQSNTCWTSWTCGHERWGHDNSKKHRKSGQVLSAVHCDKTVHRDLCKGHQWLKEVSGSTVRRQYTEIFARSPTGKETGGDKVDTVVANSHTDPSLEFRLNEAAEICAHQRSRWRCCVGCNCCAEGGLCTLLVVHTVLPTQCVSLWLVWSCQRQVTSSCPVVAEHTPQ